MFSQVSVCPQRGMGVSAFGPGGEGVCHNPPAHTSKQTPPKQTLPGQTSPRQTPPWADTTLPQSDTPPARHPSWADTPPPSTCWDTHTPCSVHAGIHPPCWSTRSTSRRYASHWNAFLLLYTKVKMFQLMSCCPEIIRLIY